MECISSSNYQVAWRYLVAYRILYWAVLLIIFPQIYFSSRINTGIPQSNRVREIDELPVVLLEYLLLEEIKSYQISSRSILFVGVNKLELIDFLLEDSSTNPKHHQLIRDKTIYFTARKDAFKVNVIGEDAQCQLVTELSSNQEEAATKVFLAVKLAQEIEYTDAVIYTVDSDVTILGMYYSSRLVVNLFAQLGTGINVRIIVWAIQIDNQSSSRPYHYCMPFQVVIWSVHSMESVKQSSFLP